MATTKVAAIPPQSKIGIAPAARSGGSEHPPFDDEIPSINPGDLGSFARFTVTDENNARAPSR